MSGLKKLKHQIPEAPLSAVEQGSKESVRPAAAGTVVSVRDLHKTYRKGFIPRAHKVLRGVSFDVHPGKIVGFLGGNGAGKTTTLKCLLGLAFPEKGEVQFFGEPLSNRVKRRIGFLPERPYFYDYLTGEEFLIFYGRLSQKALTRADLRQRLTFLLKKLDLLHARDRRLRGYSKGMLQKIGVAQALIHRPDLVILDEPMAGLDPDGRFYVSEMIRECAREGATVFFSSHLLNDVERLCDDLIVLKDGVLSFEGPTQDLVNRMGTEVSVYYVLNGRREKLRLSDGAEMNKKLAELLEQKAQIVEVLSRHSLEEAFVKWGLRGD